MSFRPFRWILAESAVLWLVPALISCAAVSQPSGEQHGEIAKIDLRRPALTQFDLVEGFNVVDRAPSGVSLAARVKGEVITDWRVFDDQGEVVFQKRSDDGLGWWDACLISGGEPGFHIDGRLACCWEGWGCLVCTQDEQECEMKCDTQKCRDANGQALPPVVPEDPSGRPTVAVNPDRLVIAVDPEMPGWTVRDAAGARMHLAPRRSEALCPICVQSRGHHICWKLPCLPATINAACGD